MEVSPTSLLFLGGADSDPEKLAHTDELLNSVLCEANLCCGGQLVILVGDFHSDPLVIPVLP